MDSQTADQEFCLRWNNHENNMCAVLDSMLQREILVDATLSCEGKSFRVHKAVLSACSPYFEQLFSETTLNSYPIVVLRDVQPNEVKSLIDYCYTGQVMVGQSQLNSFLKIAESLKIRGLANHLKNEEKLIKSTNFEKPENVDMPVKEKHWIKESIQVPPRKRKRHYSAEYQNIPKLLHITQPVNNRSEAPSQNRESETAFQGGPTDLSFQQLESEMPPFQPVISHITSGYPSVSSEAQKFTLQPHTGGVGSFNFKPKEFAVPPEALNMMVNFPDRVNGHTSESTDGDRMNSRSAHNSPPTVIRDSRDSRDLQLPEPGPSFRHNVRDRDNVSDDDDCDYPQRDMLEGCSSMVRSGVCNVCGCFRSDLRQHMESHSGQSFQCCLCGRAYPRRKTLNQHIKRSHPSLTSDSSPPSSGSSFRYTIRDHSAVPPSHCYQSKASV